MAYRQLPNGLLDISNPASTIQAMKQDVIQQPANLLSVNPRSLNLPSGGGGENPNQAQVNSFFNNMTPGELSAFQANQAQVINSLLTPTLSKCWLRLWVKEIHQLVHRQAHQVLALAMAVLPPAVCLAWGSLLAHRQVNLHQALALARAA